MSDPAPASLPARYANGRFGPGNPGRRAGTRNRMSHRATLAILEDFELHGAEVLDRLRRWNAPAYFAILVRLLERQLQVDTPNFADCADAELAGVVGLARAALLSEENPRAALIELDRVLRQASEDPL